MSAADGGTTPRPLAVVDERAEDHDRAARWRRWAAEDLALLVRHYRGKGPAWCAERLGRTTDAVMTQAAHHGITQRRWTEPDVRILCAEWGEVSERSLREKLGGRTTRAIAKKAERLGLANPSQGLISLNEAVSLTGLNRHRLLRVLRVEGVHVHVRVRANPRARAQYRQLVVDRAEVTEAVARWIHGEAQRLTFVEVRARFGMTLHHAQRALRRLHVLRPLSGFDTRVRSFSLADVEVAIEQHRDPSRCWRVPTRCTAGLCVRAVVEPRNAMGGGR